MTKQRSRGEKFTEKYGVSAATIYRGDPSRLLIPPKDHPLFDATAPNTFDAVRVEAIDRDGTMNDPIEVWTDPDTRKLWIIDGRGRKLDVDEVNRRRSKRGAEPVLPLIVPFAGDEKAAIARVREKNYHRRVPKSSDMATDLLVLRRQGFSWQDCAAVLHVDVSDAEQWGKRLLPLAYCIDEVKAAIDSGEFPRTCAVRFGGRKPDGIGKLGRQDQLTLLAQMRARREHSAEDKPKMLTPKIRERVRVQLTSWGKVKPELAMVAEVVVATLACVDGEPRAMQKWPEINAAIATAFQKPERKPPKKQVKQQQLPLG